MWARYELDSRVVKPRPRSLAPTSEISSGCAEVWAVTTTPAVWCTLILSDWNDGVGAFRLCACAVRDEQISEVVGCLAQIISSNVALRRENKVL